MDIEIQQVHTPTAPEALLRELSDYYTIIEAEDMPGDPPTPLEMRVADWRHVSTHYPEVRWILRDDDGIAAAAVAAFDVDQNLENGFGRIHVHPDKRRRGYGRALATPMFDHLEKNGRTRLETWVKKDDPGESLVFDLGLKRVYEDKRSRLSFADLDLELMGRWVERAAERATEYELVHYQAPLPEEIVPKFCDLTDVMNTAPREDFEEEDEVMTPERWREFESNVIDSKCQLHLLIAVHKPTDDFAGYTMIKTQDLQPDIAWQEDTGVDPSHRNKGLGRWLKAAMIRRIIGSHPAVNRVDTYNAGSNEPMLNINVEMGFRPVHIAYVWQGGLATVRERLRA
jgi:mycothiol synthase